MLAMKFPTPNGVGIIKGDHTSARVCYASVAKVKTAITTDHFVVALEPKMESPTLDPRDEECRTHREPMEESKTLVFLEKLLTRVVRIGTKLTLKVQAEMVCFLRVHTNVSAWSYVNITGSNSRVISHRLSLDSYCKTVQHER